MDSAPHSPGPRRRRLHPLLTIVFVVAVVALSPLALFTAAMWAATGAWEFEGRSGVYHWLFIKGAWIDRLDLVEPAGGPPRWSVSLQEGTFPGWAVLGYNSSASPAEILDTYAARCRKLGLKVTKEPAVWEHGVNAMYLECEIRPYIDAQFVAERKPPAELTDVGVRVWGRD
jgi:hypothetical protein